MIAKLNYIFDRRSKFVILVLSVVILIGGFLEMLGVTVFYPFIELILNKEAVENNNILEHMFGFLNINQYTERVAVLAFGIIIFYLLKNVYLTIMQNCILKFEYNTRMRMATRLLSSYMKEPYAFHLQRNSAELIRTLETDCGQFMLLINGSLQIIVEAVMCIAIGIYLLYTSYEIALIVGGLLVACVGLYYFISKKVSLKIGLRNQGYNTKLFQWANQALGGIKEVKILERENYFVEAYEDNYKKFIKGTKNNELLAAVPKYITETVAMAGLLSVIIVKMLYGHEEPTAFVPQLTAFAIAAFKLLPAVGKISAYNNRIMYSRPSLDAIYNDLKAVEDVKDEGYADADITHAKASLQKDITVHDITYQYPTSENPVLENVNLEIIKGQAVAFVGSSGAGKTTMADIILGLLEPQSGKILVDGWDIKENMSKWHHMIGYIPQTIYLSDDTITRNVAFGVKDDDIDMSAVEAALRKAQLYDFVTGLPDGFDTYVGDRGTRLSGGQRQRIGIARALYHNPDVLVLDEATSALDNETEQAVMESIDALKGQKTMIIIAHRLSTIENADVVFEVGEHIIKKRER